MTISKKIPLVFCAATAFALAHANPSINAPAFAADGAPTAANAGNATIAKKDMTDAEIAEVVRKAELGDPANLLALGTFHAYAQYGFAKDPQKAMALVLAAAQKSFPPAEAFLGYLYGEGKVIPQDMKKAVYWREKAATDGDAQEKWSVGSAYLYGFMLPKDQIRALYWITEAANAGNAPAILKLVEIYKNLKDKKQFSYWQAKRFELEIQGAKNGDSEIMAEVARKYMLGKGGAPQNKRLAVHWYLKAAEAGNQKAMEKVAQMYAKGKFLKKNPQKAQEYFEKLAQSDASYCFKISAFYADGSDGFPEDEELALFWLERAAEKSNYSTKMYVAWKYWAGNAIKKNPQKALFWFNEALKEPVNEHTRDSIEKSISAIKRGQPAPQKFAL